MLDNPFVVRFINLARGWNAEGFAEHMLWGAVEGRPVGIWAFPEVVTVEIMEVLRTLRDDLQIWPFWSLAEECWDTISIPTWRAHAANISLNDVLVRLRSAA